MKKYDLAKVALVNSLGVAGYVLLVAVFMQNANRIFGKADSVFSAMAAMLLLVFSAGITGSLVFGKPVLMYLDNAKKEAVWLLGYTFAWLFAWLMLSFLLVAAMR